MSPKLYYFEASPPARSVLMTIKALDLTIDLIRINLTDKDQLKDDFLKLNPTHTVPTLDDDGFVIWDSHAIVQYLCDKYKSNQNLYPKEFETRTLVNQMLFFETSILFPSLARTVRPIFYDDATKISQDKILELETALGFLETFLTTTDYVAGNQLTVADICCLATVSTMNIFYNVNSGKFPAVTIWFRKLQGLDWYDANNEGIQKFSDMFLPLLKE